MTEDEMAGWHHRLNGHEFGHPLSSAPSPSSRRQDAWNGHGCLERPKNTQSVRKDWIPHPHSFTLMLV